ncbi:MAG: MoxR family ATPase [Deltaproteobacteria bacterium]|nr:MoxR family ATPase [Deltaproteobacteria bacterium]
MTLDPLLKIPGNIVDETARHYFGSRNIIKYSIATFFSGGHLLLEDVPGVGKTTLARTIAGVLGLDAGRIQCTPDLLPSDVVGYSVPTGSDGNFQFRKGPVFSNILLVDEINRAAPRTQSAFLEAMEENQVTVEGETRALLKPFFVIATQNPVEIAGTYPLPESQLDRFDMRLLPGYPLPESEMQLLKMTSSEKPHSIQTMVDNDEISQLMTLAKSIKIADSLVEYVLKIGLFSRKSEHLRLGISPRALISWIRIAKALAMVDGRQFVVPEDLHETAFSALAHRMVVRQDYMGLEFSDSSEVLTSIIESVPLPL